MPGTRRRPSDPTYSTRNVRCERRTPPWRSCLPRHHAAEGPAPAPSSSSAVASWLDLVVLPVAKPQAAKNASPLDHADGAHARHLLRQPGVVDHFHDVIDILVRFRLFFRQSFFRLRPGDDAARLQLLVDTAADGVLDGGGTAHGAARTVAGGAQRPVPAARPTRPPPTPPAPLPPG